MKSPYPEQRSFTSRSLYRRRTCAPQGHSGVVGHLASLWQTIGMLDEASDATIIGVALEVDGYYYITPETARWA